ncbi:MAG: 16S rRNA (adenine(1518)-N(6)/adenine(1519)-N(6))-dimethyltransferase RsmA [Actinobacteria bacterium]|nr:16S rRNA (adenine(1518)-N(6)/adenine(1519)-N(6))-dimethyltransferase RsmA [Actinomycetota bacterium]MCG2806677.1 16S rRNA (adenine(1518)-N(6)/adenine(1519)-N(6))-dimethyltransferase RsmA [Coriobacteriia bacterium]
MAYSRLASPSATLSVLESRRLSTRKSLGQHFLVDDNIVGRILSLADLDSNTSVLEIGPGIGTLTVALCGVAAHVVAVERDERLGPQLTSIAEECGNLSVIQADAVSVDMETLTGPGGPPTTLVANLPYGVAATVVLRYFQELSSLKSATIMVQAEVASRMTAVPSTKDYGSYSVKLQLLTRPAGRFAVPRSCFMPPPRVDSSVVRLERVERSEAPETITAASQTANAAFAQRRKTLRNSLRSSLALSDDELSPALAAAGIDGSRRAETLSVEEFLILGAELHQQGLLP